MVSTRSGLSTQAANVLVALAQVAWLTGRVADLKAIIANLRALVASLTTQRDAAQLTIVRLQNILAFHDSANVMSTRVVLCCTLCKPHFRHGRRPLVLSFHRGVAG